MKITIATSIQLLVATLLFSLIFTMINRAVEYFIPLPAATTLVCSISLHGDEVCQQYLKRSQ